MSWQSVGGGGDSGGSPSWQWTDDGIGNPNNPGDNSTPTGGTPTPQQVPTPTAAPPPPTPGQTAAGNWQNAQYAAESAGFTPGPNVTGLYNGYGANTAQNTTINTGLSGADRNAEQALAARLNAQANGQGPSLAQSQLKSGTTNNINTALALAAANGGGGNPGVAAGRVAAATAAANQTAAGQSADLRMQEQLGSQGQLGSLEQGITGQDIGLATNQAQLNQQTALANTLARNNAAQFNAGARENEAGALIGENQFQNEAVMGQVNKNAGVNNANIYNAINTGVGVAGSGLSAYNAFSGGNNNGNNGYNSNPYGNGYGGDSSYGGGGSGDFSQSYDNSNQTPQLQYPGSASGNVFTKPGKTVMGEGGRPEAVIPLSDEEGIQAFLKAMAVNKQKQAEAHDPMRIISTPQVATMAKNGPQAVVPLHDADGVHRFNALLAAASDLHRRTSALEDKVLGPMKKRAA